MCGFIYGRLHLKMNPVEIQCFFETGNDTFWHYVMTRIWHSFTNIMQYLIPNINYRGKIVML